MRFGFLIRPQDPPTGERAHARWQEMLTSARIAEEVGFDGVFLAEHHGMPDWAGSSPWGPLGAIAATTERVEIGTTVHVLPLQNPFSVAEHAATLDVMSGGRLRLGVGVGFVAEEAELYGLDPELRNERFEEGIEIVQRLWAGESAGPPRRPLRRHRRLLPAPARRRALGRRNVGPRRPPRRPSRCSMADRPRARHRGDELPLATSTGVTPPRQAMPSAHACACCATPGSPTHSMTSRRSGGHTRAPSTTGCSADFPVGWPAASRMTALIAEDDFNFARHHVDRLIVGSPQDCIDKIRRFQEELDMDYLIMSFRQGSGPSAAEEVESIRRFGEEVIPAFRT